MEVAGLASQITLDSKVLMDAIRPFLHTACRLVEEKERLEAELDATREENEHLKAESAEKDEVISKKDELIERLLSQNADLKAHVIALQKMTSRLKNEKKVRMSPSEAARLCWWP